MNALDECIDSQTMDLHYNKHHRKYYENFMEAFEKSNHLEISTYEELFSKISSFSLAIRNNGGGLYNHTIYWNSMTPNYRNCVGELKIAIEQKWKTMDLFKKAFSAAAENLFASGWVWLILDKKNELQIISTANHDNPLMDLSPSQGLPLLVSDVWEHAYYLRYKNERSKYVNSWWDVVNWKYAEDQFKLRNKSDFENNQN